MCVRRNLRIRPPPIKSNLVRNMQLIKRIIFRSQCPQETTPSPIITLRRQRTELQQKIRRTPPNISEMHKPPNYPIGENICTTRHCSSSTNRCCLCRDSARLGNNRRRPERATKTSRASTRVCVEDVISAANGASYLSNGFGKRQGRNDM